MVLTISEPGSKVYHAEWLGEMIALAITAAGPAWERHISPAIQRRWARWRARRAQRSSVAATTPATDVEDLNASEQVDLLEEKIQLSAEEAARLLYEAVSARAASVQLEALSAHLHQLSERLFDEVAAADILDPSGEAFDTEDTARIVAAIKALNPGQVRRPARGTESHCCYRQRDYLGAHRQHRRAPSRSARTARVTEVSQRVSKGRSSV